jgi:hypothetical protein
MTNMLPRSLGQMSSVFGDDSSKKDRLSTGISVGYPILRIKGKVWSITRGGNEPFVLMRPDGDGPRNSIDVVLLAASQCVSKVFYETGYVEGSTSPPDCFSTNGVVPDASSTKKQSNTCAACPQNAWGSRITPAGKKAKACQDSKRVAVAPLGDIRNEAFGGPMMLRVPAASLTDFANYGDGLEGQGYRYYTVGTKMSFDANEAYPKLVFEPIRTLEDGEAEAVVELRKSAAVTSILAEDIGGTQETYVEPTTTQVTPQVTAPQPARTQPAATTPVAPVTAVGNGFDGTAPKPAVTAPQPKPTVRKTQPAAAVSPPAAAPPPVAASEAVAGSAISSSFEDTLDAQLDELLPGVA